MAPKRTPHDTAISTLIPPDELPGYQRRVQSLIARNQIVGAIEDARKEAGLSKTGLARLAGLDESSVRRLLTARTANPTAEVLIRLLAATHVRVQVTLPSGAELNVV